MRTMTTTITMYRLILVFAVVQTARGLPSVNGDRSSRFKSQPTSFIFHLLKKKLNHPVVQKIVTPEPSANCICVPFYQCNSNATIVTDGSGVIDERVLLVSRRRCTGDLEICCGLPPPSMAPIVVPATTTTQPPTTPSTPMPTTMTAKTTPEPPTSPPTTTTTEPPTTTMEPTSPPTMATTTMQPTTQPPTTMKPTEPPTMPPTISPVTNCICVPVDQCDVNGYVVVAGEGIINPRQTLNPCPIANQICCKLPSTTPQTRLPVVTAGPPVVQQPVVCVCVASQQCDPNGYTIVSGAGSLDPRFRNAKSLGLVVGASCPSSNEICCVPLDSPQGNSVGFPVVAYPGNTILGVVKNPGTDQACVCVRIWQCLDGQAVTFVGAGVTDPRFGPCRSGNQVCCRFEGVKPYLVAAENPVVNVGNPSVVIVNPNPVAAQPSTLAICGLRTTACLSACATKPGEASFAEFPWMVALFVRKPGGTSLTFQCGASLINTRSVLTAAHCVIDRPEGALVARFGEWNTANTDEPAPFQEVDVQAVITHPLYYKGGLYNDVAVLVLSKPINYAVNVVPICLPEQGMKFSAGTRCLASGWGRSAFEGQYQTILRKVELPIVDRDDCQTRLRTTRLGQYFRLHESFVCAGGEPNKDACRGDGGGPLVCSTATGQFIQAGIISWGIGCGESNIPAVYASVSQFRQWIDLQLANHEVL